jgi:hypothetical protein
MDGGDRESWEAMDALAAAGAPRGPLLAGIGRRGPMWTAGAVAGRMRQLRGSRRRRRVDSNLGTSAACSAQLAVSLRLRGVAMAAS